MIYDVKMHLPDEIQSFLEGVRTFNEQLVEASYSNIRDLVGDESFKSALDGYDSDFKKKINKIKSDALSKIKTDIDSFDDVIPMINETVALVGKVYSEYISTVLGFLLGWAGKML